MNFDAKLRLFTYRHLIRTGQAPRVAESAKALSVSVAETRAAYERLSESHAFMLQPEDGELWRIAPFSAVPTPFPVQVGKKSWYGTCAWDALGIPAALGKDATIRATCGCCNQAMTLRVRKGRLLEQEGMIHFAVAARDWYKDVVFT